MIKLLNYYNQIKHFIFLEWELVLKHGFHIYKTTNNFQHNDINRLVYMLDNNSGIYNLNLDSLKKYCNLYYNSIKNSDYLACFINDIINEQKFMKPNNKQLLYSRILEPFYCCLEDIKPWSHYLVGKKVLIISPFVESFKKQLENKFQIFKDLNKKYF